MTAYIITITVLYLINAGFYLTKLSEGKDSVTNAIAGLISICIALWGFVLLIS